ncbi:MAG: site-specific integrase [Synergistaceae bacterium]|jgi:integrase|nr:site-specific integrase [Synergistaceae bacterium]
MALTELALKKPKPKDKRYLVRDYQGLYIEVNPTGRKYWKMRYMVDGQAKKVTLGEYPYVSLKEAQQKRDEEGVRPSPIGEVRRTEWAETNFDAAEWRIPAEKMKARKVPIVLLVPQTLRILQDMKTLTGHGCYVFPSPRAYIKGDTPMSENAITSALRRLGFEKDQMTVHGFRAMANTLLYEQGWPSDVVERQMAHIVGGAVRQAYDYSQFLNKWREMMRWWADWLDGLKRG